MTIDGLGSVILYLVLIHNDSILVFLGILDLIHTEPYSLSSFSFDLFHGCHCDV